MEGYLWWADCDRAATGTGRLAACPVANITGTRPMPTATRLM